MIKTWQQRCEEHPDHQQGIVTQQMIQDRMQEEIDELRQALSQPEQEPVECMCGICKLGKREWQGLTDEEIDGIYKTHHDQYGKCQTGGFEYERTIEAKLKEKNT